MRALLLLWAAVVGCGSDPEPAQADRVYASRDAVMAELLARVDADGSGAIDRDEYHHSAADDGSFRAYDADGDGLLDASELELALLDADPTTRIERRQAPGFGPPPGTGGPAVSTPPKPAQGGPPGGPGGPGHQHRHKPKPPPGQTP